MKNFLFLLLFVLFTGLAFGQSYTYRAGKCGGANDFCPRDAIYHETNWDFKRLGINSLNWDHVITCKDTYMTSFRLGLNYLTFSKVYGAGIPFDLNMMIGGGAWLFDFGLGINYLYFYKNYDTESGANVDNAHWGAITGHVGIRYERLNGIFLKAGFTPNYTVVGYNDVPAISDRKILYMAGLAIGWTFDSK